MPVTSVSPRPLLIIAAGRPVESLRRHGGFAHWIRVAAGLQAGQVQVVDVESGEPLPAHDGFAGVIISGSAAMVTERLAWSEHCAAWLREAAGAGVPALGICYGHQLLAHALGGEVADNPEGRRMGTYAVELLEACQQIGVDGDEVRALKLWRERVKQTSDLEDQFSEELMQTPLLNSLLPHGLTAFEISEIEAELCNFRPVSRAWLVRKQLNTIRARPIYLLFAEMGGQGEAEGITLGEQIHDRLEVPGALYVMRVEQAAMREDIERQGFKPVYLRAYG